MKAAGALLVLAITSGCFVTPVMTFGGGKSSEQVQHEGLDRLFPAQLAATERWTGAPRVARLRVWADDAYRAQNMRWQHGFDEQLAYANAVLAPMLGIRLEAEYHAWERHAPDAPLAEHLTALARQDTGDDVVWVVGLTSSLSLVAEPFEQIGVARLAAPYVVVRGHADVEERKGFERAFPDIDREQRELVLEARRRHKTAALLIHELAHSLGALHEVAEDSVMHPSYSHRAASLGGRNRELMLITLADRLKSTAARDPQTTGRKLLAALEDEWAGWRAGERDRWIAELRAMTGAPADAPVARPAVAPRGAVVASRNAAIASRGATDTAAPVASPPVPAPVPVLALLPPAALDKLREIETSEIQDADAAAAQLAPLLTAYPGNPRLHLLNCRLAVRRSDVKAPEAVAACDRAASLSADLGPALEVAELRRSRGDFAGARATIAAAEGRLATLPADQAAASWNKLAWRYLDAEAVTWAETAAAHAGDAARDVAAWAEMTRIRFGIPRDAARYRLAPDDDAAALAAVRDVLAKVYRGEFAAAAKAVAIADKRWPGLPGVLAARCDLEIRRGETAAARQHCARAMAQGSSWATYLAGVIELNSGSKATAIARLRKAIELDPALIQAWTTLAKIFRRSNAIADLDQVHRDFRAQFHAELPP
jgi:hypothetical protein